MTLACYNGCKFHCDITMVTLAASSSDLLAHPEPKPVLQRQRTFPLDAPPPRRSRVARRVKGRPQTQVSLTLSHWDSVAHTVIDGEFNFQASCYYSSKVELIIYLSHFTLSCIP